MAKVAGLPARLSFEQAYNLDAKAPFRLYFPEESARHVVDSLLFNGANSRILMRAGTGQLLEVAIPAEAPAIAEGDAATVNWRPDHALVFARRAG